jgi:hypothetical protein
MSKNMYGLPNHIYLVLGGFKYTSDPNGLIANVLDEHAPALEFQRCMDEDAWLKLQAAHPSAGGITQLTGDVTAGPGSATASPNPARPRISSLVAERITVGGVASAFLDRRRSAFLNLTSRDLRHHDRRADHVGRSLLAAWSLRHGRLLGEAEATGFCCELLRRRQAAAIELRPRASNRRAGRPGREPRPFAHKFLRALGTLRLTWA